MTENSARTAANVVLAAAGIGAAYVILTTPPLRRLALRAVEFWLGASIPAYVMSETRRAWAQSNRTA
jgi:hypothetical protein